jgi:hypothetical protein
MAATPSSRFAMRAGLTPAREQKPTYRGYRRLGALAAGMGWPGPHHGTAASRTANRPDARPAAWIITRTACGGPAGYCTPSPRGQSPGPLNPSPSHVRTRPVGQRENR